MKKLDQFCVLILLINGLLHANNNYLLKIPITNQIKVSNLIEKQIPLIMELSSEILSKVSENQLELLNGIDYTILDTIDENQSYYFVIPKNEQVLRDIKKRFSIISEGYSDEGQYLIIKLPSEQIPELNKFPVELVKLFWEPFTISEPSFSYPEITFNPLIQQMVNSVNQDSVLTFLRRLQRFRTRYSTTDSCRAAATWLKNKFQSYNCDSVYLHNFSSSYAPNVVAIKHGYLHPDNIYVVICGHFDATSNQPPNNCPGIDDNGSGTCAVLEAARVMKDFNFEYSIRYICFSAEEQGLIGSNAYAQQARNQGDSILAVLNFDMIGYSDVNPEDLEVYGKNSNPNCTNLVNYFVASANMYTGLTVTPHLVSSFAGSDHHSFWQRGYVGICAIEDYPLNNPHYHLVSDTIGGGFNNLAFCTEVIKAGIATLAGLASPIFPNRPMVTYQSYRLSELSGNNNFFWDAGESINLYIKLRNLGQVPANSVSTTINTLSPFITIIQPYAYYGTINPLDTAVNNLPYVVYASESTPIGYNAQFTLTITNNDTTWYSSFLIPVGRFTPTDPIPDGPRYPPRYWAYDNTDSAYQQRPVYNWYEIKNIGTRLQFDHNDQVRIVQLPAAFGPLKFYGRTYNAISVSVDGFIVLGSDTTRAYINSRIPSPDGPAPIIAINWDDLVHSNSGIGGVWWYYNPFAGMLIVEWDSLSYYQASSVRDKFQVIIYDSSYHTPTEDNIIVVQYMTANRYTSSTVGIEDSSEAIGIQYLFDNEYHPGAAPIIPGRAIKYTTHPPSGVYLSENTLQKITTQFSYITAHPNPFSDHTRINLALRGTNNKQQPLLKIYNSSGQLIKSLSKVPTFWDGKDNLNRKVKSGVYFVVADDAYLKVVYLKD
jgi:hypothetical protein